ncbi:MAG: hypothetical protein ACO3D8_05065, partial [Ilumatobacteraceae bacterium]
MLMMAMVFSFLWLVDTIRCAEATTGVRIVEVDMSLLVTCADFSAVVTLSGWGKASTARGRDVSGAASATPRWAAAERHAEAGARGRSCGATSHHLRVDVRLPHAYTHMQRGRTRCCGVPGLTRQPEHVTTAHHIAPRHRRFTHTAV